MILRDFRLLSWNWEVAFWFWYFAYVALILPARPALARLAIFPIAGVLLYVYIGDRGSFGVKTPKFWVSIKLVFHKFGVNTPNFRPQISAQKEIRGSEWRASELPRNRLTPRNAQIGHFYWIQGAEPRIYKYMDLPRNPQIRKIRPNSGWKPDANPELYGLK